MGIRMSQQSALSMFLFLLLLASDVSAQSCLLTHKFNRVERSFKTCQNLVEQGATLAWSHIANNNTLDVVFSGTAPSAGGWVGWGINPTSPAMIGADTFIAFTANGSSNLLTYKLTTDIMKNLPSPGPIDLKVLNKEVEISGSKMKMYLSIKLPNNKTTLNHIWNRGSGMNNLSPLPHGQADVKSVGKINIAAGTVASASAPHQKLKNRHGIINTVGWGLLLPIGVMSARYLRSFESADPAWFYIHSFCQSSGYILGVVGWATGIKLGSYSSGVFYKHRNLGLTIFIFATLQVLSLLLRPKKEHKIRKYWNVYHHTIGYATIAMVIVNIFEGFSILQPDRKWKHAYTGVIASLGAISLILEIVTWILYLHRKKRVPAKGAGGSYPPNGTSLGLPHGQPWSAANGA